MSYARRPRFERSRQVRPIQLTKRDRNIICEIYRHRFLRSSHVAALVGSSRQQVLRSCIFSFTMDTLTSLSDRLLSPWWFPRNSLRVEQSLSRTSKATTPRVPAKLLPTARSPATRLPPGPSRQDYAERYSNAKDCDPRCGTDRL
jgi:hypothetical protein